VRAERNGAIQGAQSRTSPHRSLLFTSFRWLGTPGPLTAITRKCPSNASVRGQRFTCARRRHVSVPESNFLIRVAPSKPAKWVPFQAGTNTSLVVVPNRMIPSHSDSEPPDEWSPLPLLSASLSACPISSPTTRLQPAGVPAATPARLPPAPGRFRLTLPAGLPGECAQVARGSPWLLEAIPSEPPRASGTQSPAAATP